MTDSPLKRTSSVRFVIDEIDNNQKPRRKPIARPQLVDDASFIVKTNRFASTSTPIVASTSATLRLTQKKSTLTPSSSLEVTDSGADQGGDTNDDDDAVNEEDNCVSGADDGIVEDSLSLLPKKCHEFAQRVDESKFTANFVPLTTLPWHIQRRIFTQVPCRDRRQLRMTCKFLEDLLNDAEYWRDACVVLRNTSDFTQAFWDKLARRNIQGIDLGTYRREVDWERLQNVAPNVTWLRSWVKCDKNSGLPEGIHRMYGLQHLSVTTLFADWALFADLRRFAFLRTLKLNITVAHVSFDRTQALRWLFDLQELQDIELTFRRYVILDQSQFRHLLYRLPKLRRLALIRNGFRFVDISGCFRRPKLPDNFADAAKYVHRLQLRELDVSGTLKQPLDDEAMTQLATLETFRLQQHDMAEEQVDYFLERVFEYWRDLVCLDLRGAAFSGDVFSALKSKSLRQVHLSFKHVEYPQRALLKLSQRAPTLTELFIYDVQPDDASKLKYLADYFPKLTTLYLQGNLGILSREFLFALADLRSHVRLVNIGSCRACPEGVWDILRALMGKNVQVV